ncbi:MAG TPA: DUF2293 domain-containing protein [Bryobacteraceae bacterium]|nr:DUF2293 domain-containing protein [Bryobacteraceae bacterium]
MTARVIPAAEAALADHSYVSSIDVLVGMGLLAPSNVNAWRQGRIDFLELVIQGNPDKISSVMAAFRKWAREAGLRPSETAYVRRTRNGTADLRFSKSGDPSIELNYRTHFVSPALSELQQKRLQEKLDRPPETVVFQTLRDSQCSECGAEVERDSLLCMEAGQQLCLACARLDHLEFLASGDAALTRRAAKYGRTVVVVRFSRSRKRYERQGILAEPAALEKAEQECTEDAAERTAARARDAARRREEDRVLAIRMAQKIQTLFPRCPTSEAAAIAEHTARRGSGRVGRTAAGRELEERALTLAVAAAVRHNHSNYDELLAAGIDRADARQRVAGEVDEILAKWRG